MYGLLLSERPTELCNTESELKATIIAVFTILNKETTGKACRRFQSRLESMVEANGNF